MKVIKRDGSIEKFSKMKIRKSLMKTFKASKVKFCQECYDDIIKNLIEAYSVIESEILDINQIQDIIESTLVNCDLPDVAKSYILYRHERDRIREFAKQKQNYIESYKKAYNTADNTIDDNSNVANKNIGVLNAEIHKKDNIQINRMTVTSKLHELYPDFDAKQYCRDLEDHIIYKNDESSFACISPYCVAITMYPFLLNGMKDLGGLSAKPKNLDSYCGMLVNLVFALSSQFAGAVALPEALLCFDYFARKEWGDSYTDHIDEPCKSDFCATKRTVKEQIHQYFQQIIYSINQPASARGMQSAFVNFSYFDEPFFHGMFDDFVFPDGTRPIWKTLNWLQKEFMTWFNAERLKCVLTFPVESFALIYKDGEFVDKENYQFVCDEYARGHSFFTYISDTVDSLSSCCFDKDQKVLWKSSTSGVHLTTLEELHNTKWEPEKKNLTIYHNGSWVKGKSVMLPNRKMYKVVTENNKGFIMTDNHINVTLDGEKQTSELTTDDYLMFNTMVLNPVAENDEHLTYEQGFAVGAFLGDGSFGSVNKGVIYDINFSLNSEKYQRTVEMVNAANRQVGGSSNAVLNEVYNNVYPVRLSSKNLAAFIMRWTNWERGTYSYNKELNMNCLLQSVEFRKGILDGWHHTDGSNSNRCYTTSKKLVECMEALVMSLGMQSRIDVSDRIDETAIIRGNEFNHNYPLYCLRWYEPTNSRANRDVNHTWVKKLNSIYFKIKSIEEVAYDGNVYCIECKNEQEPFFTLPNGLITHNCRLRNNLTTHEFNFTNGNLSVQTGSKSVISLNLSRIVQNAVKDFDNPQDRLEKDAIYEAIKKYLIEVLDRVYKYHNAYNQLLWDMYEARLMPAYDAGFINLDKQYLTIGLNGLNQAAEFLGLKCTKNKEYGEFCHYIFGTVKEQNALHKTPHTMFNTEQVPAESLAVKNYNWDKEDGYWVPDDTNLYASYIFKPNDKNISVLDKIAMHGRDYIGDYLDGGAAAHINLEEHLTSKQYDRLLRHAAENGCQYLTFNIPISQCDDCGHIVNAPVDKCPKCGSEKITTITRIIGYLTAVKNWSDGRRKEFKTRVFNTSIDKGEE